MKTPDEIKKALECCFYDSAQCGECPYYPVSCDRELVRDAREYIRQLESDKQQLVGMLTHMNQLRDAAAGRALQMEERADKLEAERDAAVKDLESMADYVLDDVCEWCSQTAKSCKHPCNFKWRGVQKEE